MTLALRPFIRIIANVSPPIDFGDPGGGVRRCIPITGGSFTGEFEGEVLPGADWQTILPSGALEISAHYGLRTKDGALIEVCSDGVRHGPAEILAQLARGEAVDPALYYFRTAIRMKTSAAALARLNTIIALSKGERRGASVHLDVFEVL